MQLSACLIVRDEQAHLPQCLSRLQGLVNEIIVVDTGSVDATISIAKSHGARVFHQLWQDDFSLARNYALDQAQGEWILYIDADEHFSAEPGALEQLDKPSIIAATVAFRPASYLTTYSEHRLFRNRPDIRFKGAIHETVVPDIHRLQTAQGLQIVEVDCSIEHWGYEGDLSHKHRRNHSMLLQAVAKDPERTYLWHALGECELGLGAIAEAEQAWRSALALVRKTQGKASNAIIYSDLLSLHFFSSASRLKDIEKIIAEAAAHHPQDPLVQWWLARCALDRGNISKAEDYLAHLQAFGPDGPSRGELAYDRRLFGEYLWQLAGSCALQNGNNGSAVELLSKAALANPQDRETAAKLTLARSRQASVGAGAA